VNCECKEGMSGAKCGTAYHSKKSFEYGSERKARQNEPGLLLPGDATAPNRNQAGAQHVEI
jgi:hypothetical protein